MMVQRGLSALLLLLGVALVRAGSSASTAGPAPDPLRAEAPAGVLTTTTLTLEGPAQGTPTPMPGFPCGWSISESPNLYGDLNSIAALAANDVWAVGQYGSGSNLQTLVEHWDGSTWSIIPSPNGAQPFNELRGVAALAPNDIWAVGVTHTGLEDPLILHWDGNVWSIVPSPNPGTQYTSLSAVTALAANDVWAVGSSDSQPFIEHWDGNQWSVVPSPSFSIEARLYGVSGRTANDVWAVGYDWQGTAARTLTVHWNGTQWSVVPSPNVGASENYLLDVTMLAANDVWAVGYYYDQSARRWTLTQHWDGSQWTVIPSPSLGSGPTLNSVSASAPNDIWAFGDAFVGGMRTLTEHWDGSTWSIVPSPNNGYSHLWGGVAISAGDAWAVGSGYITQSVTLIEHYSGLPCLTPTPATLSPTRTITASSPTNTPGPPTATLTATPPVPSLTPTATTLPGCDPAWSPVPVPNVGSLTGVDAVGPNDIWAVGSGGVLHWDGIAWSQVTVPPGGYRDVVAIAANDVWLVGVTATTGRTLTVHWDGAQWTVVPSPNPQYGNHNSLYAATTLGSNDVWAAGIGGLGGSTSFVMHWDGTQWALQELVNVRMPLNVAIDSVAPGIVWVVTFVVWSDRTYIHRWAGAQWDLQIYLDELYEVAGVTPNDAWAVGQYDPTYTFAPILRWNGTLWTPFPHPTVAALRDVDALNANDAWAVGDGATLHWDGSAWQVVPRSQGGTLRKVKMVGPNDVWAVGSNNNASWIEHYADLPRFADVPTTQPFYPFIQWMACRNYISGYQCGGPGEPCPGTYFRPSNNVTRAQLLKMVVNAAGWPVVTPATPTFADVPDTHPFYAFIETGVSRGIISGYTCGGVGEPCDPANRPYFRPANDITRGQLSKVIALARGYVLPSPPPTFADVPASHPFYGFIEAMAAHNIVSGYTCGGVGEPCDPANRPYFRGANNATRGQVSKFVTIAYGGP